MSAPNPYEAPAVPPEPSPRPPAALVAAEVTAWTVPLGLALRLVVDDADAALALVIAAAIVGARHGFRYGPFPLGALFASAAWTATFQAGIAGVVGAIRLAREDTGLPVATEATIVGLATAVDVVIAFAVVAVTVGTASTRTGAVRAGRW